MFNKSILAAALLTVGAIAGGSAVSAAEIGVRSSFGTSTRNITHGRFVAETKVRELYAETSASLAGSFSATDSTSATGEFVQPELPSYQTGARNNSTSAYRNGNPRVTNDASNFTAVRPTEFVGETSETSSAEWAGSGYVRGLVGYRGTDVSEEYRFSGTDTNTFSELSTFSR